MLRTHLIPLFGGKRLDRISTEDVQRLKHQLREKAPKPVNNVLTVLNTILRKAVEWGVIDVMPCTLRLLKVSAGSFDFYDFDEYERLTERVPDRLRRVCCGAPRRGRRTPSRGNASLTVDGRRSA